MPTETTFQVQHKGKSQIVRSNVGILLTPDYARSRGFDVKELRALGLIKEPRVNQGQGQLQDQGQAQVQAQEGQAD